MLQIGQPELTGSLVMRLHVVLLLQYATKSNFSCCIIAIIHSHVQTSCNIFHIKCQPYVKLAYWLSAASCLLLNLLVAFEPVFSWELALNSVTHMQCILSACMQRTNTESDLFS